MCTPFLVCLSALFGVTLSRDVHYYVSPTGSDTNNGTSTQFPLRTIQAAVYKAQSRQYNASDNLYVELMQGYHDLEKTLYIGQHHGKMLTIRSYKGQTVHVTGGRQIPARSFHRVTDQSILNSLPRAARSHVRYVNLKQFNITDYGTLQQWGFHAFIHAPLEVFENGQAYRMAQWPNKGYTNIVGMPDGSKGLRFKYNSTRPTSWRHLDDLWVYGFWSRGWADRSAKVASIDTRNMIVTLDNKTTSLLGLATGHWGGRGSEGGYFKFFNVLSELDQPGEYYVDKKTGNLYVWLISSKTTDVIHVSTLKECIVFNGPVHNVVLSNFIVEVCRDRGIKGVNLRNVQITNMEVRNTGDVNINIGGDSRGVSITKCRLHDGDGALVLSGGNRKLLQSSGNVAEDNDIYRYTRIAIIGKDAIKIYGFGQLIRYNNIHDGSTIALRYYGNDHIIEYNNIHNVCVDVSYCSAIYSDSDLTFRGLKIRYNHIHDVTLSAPGGRVYGVMLNHQVSSADVTNNVLYNNEAHVYIGGGRDNVIEGNIMYNATQFSMHVNGQGYGKTNLNLVKQLHAMPYSGALWKAKYPKLARIDSENYTLPEGNLIHKNLVFNIPKRPFLAGLSGWLDDPAYYNVSVMGVSLGPEDHFNPKVGDLRLRCNAAAWANKVGFQQVVSPNEVGPRYDVGPSFSKIGHKTVSLGTGSGSCPKPRPAATTRPMPAYPPDGSGQPPIFKTFNEGCWLHVERCSNDTKAVGTYRDMIGERYFHAGDNETMCLKRGYEQWKFCGSKPNEMVGVAYGPTGVQSYGGNGCLVASYGCPKHGGPADGHMVTEGKVYHDGYGEARLNASNDKEACLSRAKNVWEYCGSNPNYTVTTIFLKTGIQSYGGNGCVVARYGCPKNGGPADGHVVTEGKLFHDGYAEHRLNASNDQEACLRRAADIWKSCGSNLNHTVTMIFLKTGAYRTAGAGCWIEIETCPESPKLPRMFYDANGATNSGSDDYEIACFQRAEVYWSMCGSDSRYPVTAHFRPHADSYTYPPKTVK